jgi:tol-pal system protein YbgF
MTHPRTAFGAPLHEGAARGPAKPAPRRPLGRIWPATVAALIVTASGGARAGLFDDEEARKAILDLRARIQANDDRAQAGLADQAKAQAALLEQVNALRRSVLELNAQIEAQRAENAKLRGTQEQLARDVADLQKLTRDVSKGLDDRLRAIEPQKVSVDGKEFSADADERRTYDAAMATLRTGDFDKASVALGSFLQRWPNSGYADSARFWLGNALYGQKNYKEAINVFRAMVTSAPAHPRTPEALLAIANCQIEMKDNRAARKTLDDLVKSHPASEAALAAKERLGTLKG